MRNPCPLVKPWLPQSELSVQPQLEQASAAGEKAAATSATINLNTMNVSQVTHAITGRKSAADRRRSNQETEGGARGWAGGWFAGSWNEAGWRTTLESPE